MKKFLVLLIGILISVLPLGCSEVSNSPKKSDTSVKEESQTTIPAADIIFQNTDEMCSYFIDKWAAKDFDGIYDYASSSITDLINEKNFTYFLSDISEVSGEFKKTISNEKSVSNGNDKYSVVMQFENLDLHATFIFNNMKLNGLARYYKNTKEADISIGGNMVEKHFVVKSGAFSLNAVYTFVNDGKVHPTALIIGGSGPTDLDSTVGMLRPLHDLAVGLAENNINTLRIDKRGYLNASLMKVTDGIEEEYMTDCNAALNYIRSQPSADVNNIYIIGHSLGGQIAAEMVNRYDDIKGIVELNSSARNLAKIAYDQYAAKDPANEANYAAYRDAALNANENNCKGNYYYGAPDYYWATLNKLDTIKTIKDSNIKTLIINSKNDAQIFDTDIELWQTAFSNADNVTIKIFDNMSHFLYDIDIKDNRSLYNRVGLTDGVADTIKEFIS